MVNFQWILIENDYHDNFKIFILNGNEIIMVLLLYNAEIMGPKGQKVMVIVGN